MKLSLALATYNEANNVAACINSCKNLADEVVVVDGSSTDKTLEIARQMGARVIVTDNPPMFHINKQKAIDACTGDWIIQLDADERVTPELAVEIRHVLAMTDVQIEEYQKGLKEKELFERHQSLVQSLSPDSATALLPASAPSPSGSDARVSGSPSVRTICSADTSYNAFFIPRLNYFLGGYLRHGGVYPDGVIRLIRRGKAHLPCKDVHELMEVEGRSGWLANPLIHLDSPTFKRYLERNSRYIDHLAREIRNSKSEIRNKEFQILPFVDYIIFKPIITFFSMLIRHKGILDGWRGVVFAFFSSIRFARAYVRSRKLKPQS